MTLTKPAQYSCAEPHGWKLQHSIAQCADIWVKISSLLDQSLAVDKCWFFIQCQLKCVECIIKYIYIYIYIYIKKEKRKKKKEKRKKERKKEETNQSINLI